MAGTSSARRAAVVAFRTCIRSWSVRKSGRPRSLSAMISPSTNRSRSSSGLVASSGQAIVIAFSLRLVIRTLPSRTSVRARTPSHLTSCVHASPSGTWDALVASIGRMPDIMPGVTQDTYAVIGAGPSGLAAARNLQRVGIPWSGYELASGVGGLWDISGPRSTMYESAHLISSKTTTEFTEFPMKDEVADYPSHRDLLGYFQDFAATYSLDSGFSFGTEVVSARPSGDGGWVVVSEGPQGRRERRHAGVLVANGTLSEPSVPTFEGSFDGEILHTSAYKSPSVFAGKRVLIIGAGNSGCDIAVDAVHHAAAVDISVRRGYYFVPKYLFGKPADTLNQGKPLPPRIKQAIDSRVLKLFTGDPVKFGFPAPDYKIYESHPIVNSLVLHHLGHGDLAVRPDVRRLDGDG